MNSGHVEPLLSSYLDQTLSAADRQRLDAHLSFCPRCRQKFDQLKEIRSKLRGFRDVKPPTRLTERIVSALEQEAPARTETPASQSFPWWRWGGWVATACTALLVVIVWQPWSPQRAPVMAPATPPAEDSRDTFRRSDLGAPKKKSETKLQQRATFPKKDGAAPAFEPAPQSSVSDALSAGVEAKEEVAEMGYAPTSREVEFGKASSVTSGFGGGEKQVGRGAPAPAPMAISAQRSESKLVSTGRQWKLSAPHGDGPDSMVIRSEPEWQRLWTHLRLPSDPETAPGVDFDRMEIVLISAGERPSSGWRVQPLDVDTSQPGAPRRVRYRVAGPPPGVMVAAVMTHPVLAMETPRFAGPTVFEEIP